MCMAGEEKGLVCSSLPQSSAELQTTLGSRVKSRNDFTRFI